MAGITLAWLIGETIIVWRSVTKQHHAPIPGQLLGSSGFFALLALLAEYQPARPAATLLAFGIDLAAYLEVPIVSGSSSTTAASSSAKATGTTQAPGTATAAGRG